MQNQNQNNFILSAYDIVIIVGPKQNEMIKYAEMEAPIMTISAVKIGIINLRAI